MSTYVHRNSARNLLLWWDLKQGRQKSTNLTELNCAMISTFVLRLEREMIDSLKAK